MVVRGSRNGNIEVEFMYTVLENLENNLMFCIKKGFDQ